jgi:hypothetical protein
MAVPTFLASIHAIDFHGISLESSYLDQRDAAKRYIFLAHLL